MVGMGGAEPRELFGRAAVLQAAPGVEIGQDHDLFGAENLRRLGHELDPAKGDDIGIGLGRLARKLERIADEIGKILNLSLIHI